MLYGLVVRRIPGVFCYLERKERTDGSMKSNSVLQKGRNNDPRLMDVRDMSVIISSTPKREEAEREKKHVA